MEVEQLQNGIFFGSVGFGLVSSWEMIKNESNIDHAIDPICEMNRNGLQSVFLFFFVASK